MAKASSILCPRYANHMMKNAHSILRNQNNPLSLSACNFVSSCLFAIDLY